MARLKRRTSVGGSVCALGVVFWLAGGLVLTPALASAQLGGSSPDTAVGEVVQRILVKVNGDIVTQTELEERQIDAIRTRGSQPVTDADLVRLLRDVTPEVISTAIDELLLMQRGRELGYELTDEMFAEMVDGIREENDLNTEEEFTTALAAEGMTLPDLRQLFERQMLISQVQQVEVLSKVTLTEVEAREYYDENIEQFTEPGTVTMREIMVRVSDGPAGALADAADTAGLARAQEARDRVLAGEEFANVAIAVSDAASKANGGLIGPLDESIISEQVAAVLDELQVGDVSEPVRTAVGYQVLQLEARTRPEPRTFEEVQDMIANNVFNDRRTAEYARFLDELREEADIEWKDDTLRQAFESFDRAERIAGGAQ
ncbi:MAG: hypothetical protein F4Y45_02285 [Acidobacteria bacterium]|nr:hypothetical protein [Acidobacteriota bacterium]MXZ72301.1 hypothetical protein [Acidobacteriota bacterium]MYD71228.1 hypothetical protein [Acidobacteriota bacterium]MYJ03922.1 hypothetical protein [Acidobacteriota bacterium]